MIPLLQFLLEPLQPAIVPICLLATWGVIFIGVFQLWTAGQQGIKTVQRLHKIPCPDCQFFTGDYHLKCPVNPKQALTEQAIDCVDYRPSTKLY
jgi:hypothetical protein